MPINEFESGIFKVTWNDESLTSSEAISNDENISVLPLEEGNGYCEFAVYSNSDSINTGTIATIDFTIPADAKPGTKYDINITASEFYTIETDSNNIADDVVCEGGEISVYGHYDNLKYLIETDEETGEEYIKVFDCDESATEIDIPAEIEGLPVKSLGGEYAFYGKENLTSVKILGNVEKIGHWAFEGCNNLKSVELGSNIKEIDQGAFAGCDNLTVKIWNPDVELYDLSDRLFIDNENLTLYGPEGSTTQAFAKKYDINFKLLSEEPVTTAVTTNSSTGTTSVSTSTETTNGNL